MVDKSVIVISDDEEMKELVVPKKEKVEEEQPILSEDEKVDQDIDPIEEPPDWLPDGWIMEVYRAKNGRISQHYISPVSKHKFTMKSEVLEYLFSGMDEQLLESKENYGEKNMLQKSHAWLPKGWVMEIRAGGEKMDKMYKFYLHIKTGVRVQSKEEVLLYEKEREISMCDTDGQCDTSSTDNILAKVELNPYGLPKGWVKEEAFRKTKEGSIRRDPYYTDHVSGYTFRTLKSALCYLETGKISKHAFLQITSVHDIFNFDKSTDLYMKVCAVGLGSLTKRLQDRLNQEEYHRDSMTETQIADGDTSTGSDSSDESEEEDNIKSMKKIGKEGNSSKTIVKPPRGRLQKKFE
ncbi:hypothetical protein ACP70R_046538 [Stipagrostis hirtigluma subsp. patula]